jgi:hypothetical protein
MTYDKRVVGLLLLNSGVILGSVYGVIAVAVTVIAARTRRSDVWRLRLSLTGTAVRRDVSHHSTPGMSEDRRRERLRARSICCDLLDCEGDDGVVRFIMGDATPLQSDAQSWKADALFTWHEYPVRNFLDTSLSRKELADIGLSLVARLAALAARKWP